MFGMLKQKISEQDQKLIEDATFALINQVQGLSVIDSKALATATFIRAKDLSARDFGDHAYTPGMGKKMLNSSLAEGRISVGVLPNEIEEYWNQTPVAIAFADLLEAARLMAFIRTNKKNIPSEDDCYKVYMCSYARYGIPENWDFKVKKNLGYSEADAPLYPELRKRVDNYIVKCGNSALLFGLHTSSMNAWIRQMMKKGDI